MRPYSTASNLGRSSCRKSLRAISLVRSSNLRWLSIRSRSASLTLIVRGWQCHQKAHQPQVEPVEHKGARREAEHPPSREARIPDQETEDDCHQEAQEGHWHEYRSHHGLAKHQYRTDGDAHQLPSGEDDPPKSCPSQVGHSV